MRGISDAGIRRIAQKVGQWAQDIGEDAVAIDRVVTDEEGTAEIFYFNNGTIGVLLENGHYSQFGEAVGDPEEFLQMFQNTVMTGNYTPEVVLFSNMERSWINMVAADDAANRNEQQTSPATDSADSGYGVPSNVRY